MLMLGVGSQAKSIDDRVLLDVKNYDVDSIMNYVIFYAPFHERVVSEYTANQYIKVDLNIVRKNVFFRYLPALFRPRKNIREYFVEVFSEMHFTQPDIFDQRIIAISGTTPRLRRSASEAIKYFNINIYSQSLVRDKLLSPFAKNAKKYYRYKLERVDRGVGNRLEFTISYTPKRSTTQTVSGYFVVSNDVWSIREISYKGFSEYFEFSHVVHMGEVGHNDEFLPISCDADNTFRFFGNKIKTKVGMVVDYNKIKIDPLSKLKKTKKKYDLTESFTLQTNDTVGKASKDFEKYRRIPLTEKEQTLYHEFESKNRNDSIAALIKPPKMKSAIFWGTVGDVLISDSRVNLYDVGSVKFSPLLNPFLLTYSGRDGWAYKYKVKFNMLLGGNRILTIAPTLGYQFKEGNFYWNGNINYEYYPARRGRFTLDVGNGNRIYSSEVLDDLKNKTDTINFKRMNLKYFKSLHLNLMHTIELTNGLELGVGISSYKRTAVKNSYEDSLQLDDQFSGRYRSFAPRVKVQWTPKMYYYRDGKRKVYLSSKYPTFTLDWERGLKGAFGSTGGYERLEFDMQHKIPLGLMRNFYYRVGGGLFTNQEQMYFVDFIYFARRNLPEGWNDDIGGTFQLLNSHWYNASQHYGRFNMVYETPFLLFPNVKNISKWLLRERIYVNALIMNQLNPYVEVGYGIGTHIFDLGVFMGTANWNSPKFGFKITFELFNR